INIFFNERVVSMNAKNRNITIHTYQKIIVVFMIVLMIIFSFVDFHLFDNIKDETMVTNAILRILGGVVIIIILVALGYSNIFRFKSLGKSFLIIIPALIISINNFPMIAFFDGRATLTDPVYRVYLFLIECLTIGFFEEIIFRAMILLFLLEKLEHQKNGVLLSIVFSSMLFGFIHVFNLYSGAGIADTFLQMGYSFLIGMMWAVLFLKTRNLWLIMFLHATFNFFGQVMFYLGHVNGRYDIYTIVMTSLFALIAAAYSTRLYINMNNDWLIQERHQV
ncbi:MAG: CPBP family intramembrane metalloprotease, partial [Acholeplasmataceae bacterium]|nr:CPBP family intramembrane metalloprotease [Acholeplasmataceae bacterium]